MRLFFLSILLFTNHKVLAVVEDPCQNAYKKIVAAYQELSENILITDRSKLDGMQKFLTLPQNTCAINRTASIKQITDAISFHSHKIGMLTTKRNISDSPMHAMLEGMQVYFEQHHLSTQHFKIYEISAKKDFLQALAKLVLIDQVSLIISSLSPQDNAELLKWSDRLVMPIILPQKKRSSTQERNAFYIFPNEEKIAYSLVQIFKKMNYQKIAFMLPKNQFSTNLILTLEKHMSKEKIAVQKYMYQQGNFNSMEQQARLLFKLDDNSRRDELMQLLQDKEEEAKKEGATFNPKNILLPPLVDVDAVFIPDDFRNLRHLINIFKYFGVKKLPPIGNQKWRAKDLVDPYEPFLEGSIFYDYLGSYAELPARFLNIGKIEGEFADYSLTNQLDFSFIGFETARIATEIIKQRDLKRYEIKNWLIDYRQSKSSYFANTQVFDEQQQSNWPTFFFRIEKNDISLLR